MVVKGSTMKAVTAHVFRAANSEKVGWMGTKYLIII